MNSFVLHYLRILKIGWCSTVTHIMRAHSRIFHLLNCYATLNFYTRKENEVLILYLPTDFVTARLFP